MTKKEERKKLHKELYKLFKEVCFLRDGRECQVKKRFPYLDIMHTDLMQVDHCITRSCKEFFYEPRNGTVVCSGCNMLKSHQAKNIHRLIDQIVVEREGERWFKKMQWVDMSKLAFRQFNDITWLEKKKRELTKQKEDYESGKILP